MKSRQIPINDYFRILQLEYLSFKLRSIIYEKPEFIKMNKDIAERKKEKIQGIAKNFRFDSIFDSKSNFHQFLENEFLQIYGLPRFQYNPKNETSIRFWDKYYLFKEGTEVKYNNEYYQVIKNKPEDDSLIICVNGKELTLPYTYIKLAKISSLLEE